MADYIKQKSPGCPDEFCGGLEGSRTPDLCNANAALYQLSYKPIMDQQMFHVKHYYVVSPPRLERGLGD